MDLDILYLISTKEQWKFYSSKGHISIGQEEGADRLYGVHPDTLQDLLNFQYASATELLLILVDPIRLQVPIKAAQKDIFPAGDETNHPLNSKRFQVIEVHGSISIDAVIDRIPLKKKESETFSLTIEQVD